MKMHSFPKYFGILTFFQIMVVSALLLFMPAATQAAPKRLVVFPLEILSDKPMDFLKKGVRTMLSSRLSGADITIIDEVEVSDALNAASIEAVTDKAVAAEKAESLNADYALFGTITAAAGGYSLDLSLLDLTVDPPKFSRISDAGAENQLIPRLAKVAYQVRGTIEGRPMETYASGSTPSESSSGPYGGLFSSFEGGSAFEGPAEKGLFHRTRERTGAFSPTGSFPVNMAPMGFDMADLDGDGSPELLVVGRKRLLIYAEKEGRYVPIDKLDSPFGEEFLKVSTGDIDGSGRPEIYLVGSYGMRARTTVYEWQRGSFKQIDSIRGHLCVVGGPQNKPRQLIYQSSKVSEFISGPLHEVTYRPDGKLEIGQKIPGLADARLYSLAKADLSGNGVPEWIGVGRNKRLTLWGADGAELWRGSTRISGTNNIILAGETTGPGDMPPDVEFDPRLVVADIDEDGTYEVLAVRNIPVSERVIELLLYLKATITAYRMEGGKMVASWNTREIPYCLTDLKVYDGAIYISAEKGKVDKITEGSGRIMWFD
ncbi:MAG TPA: VCBS repeat-containing protein [Desulfobacteraceae bacterium]|nr:VCBS repeat-containing protein [Desulfobacteraceae bacterium]